MSGKSDDAADLRGPKDGEIAVFASAVASSVIDLQSAAHFGKADYQSKFVLIQTDQAIFYKWSNDGSATVDETNTNDARRCVALAAGVDRQEKPAGRYFVFKLPAAGTPGLVRIAIVQSTMPGTARVY